jgi:hypothetical protein
MRIFRLFAFVLVLGWFGDATAAQTIRNAVMYKNPTCGCCEEYAKYLRANGFNVNVIPTEDLSSVKHRHQVPEALEGCHTVVVGGYAIEGHVPIAAVKKLLDEKPKIRGISLPGMPPGSPGMAGEKLEPLTIYEIAAGPPRIFSRE